MPVTLACASAARPAELGRREEALAAAGEGTVIRREPAEACEVPELAQSI
jgi:hypothetical protein